METCFKHRLRGQKWLDPSGHRGSVDDVGIKPGRGRSGKECPFMGSRQWCRHRLKRGHQLGRLHVRTLMKKMGSAVLAPQQGSSERNPQHKGDNVFVERVVRSVKHECVCIPRPMRR